MFVKNCAIDFKKNNLYLTPLHFRFFTASYGPSVHIAKLISGREEKGFLMATKSGVKTVLKCLPPSVLLVIGKKMASKTTKST